MEARLRQKIRPKSKFIFLAKSIFLKAKKGEEVSDYQKWHAGDTRRTLLLTFKRLLAPLREPWARQRGYFRYRLNSLISLVFDRGYLSHYISKSKYFVYFLNHLPEASTFSEAPDFHDIPSIVLRLARFRPAGTQILVKEHPRTLYKRPPGFYRRISQIPGVTVLHPSVPNKQLFRSASAVLVVTGTPGLQAGAYLTPVGVLGRPAWSRAPWVTEIKNPEEIYKLRRSEVVKKKQQCILFLASYLESTFPVKQSNAGESPEEAQGRAIAEMLISTYKKIKFK